MNQDLTRQGQNKNTMQNYLSQLLSDLEAAAANPPEPALWIHNPPEVPGSGSSQGSLPNFPHVIEELQTLINPYF